ncbi:hypothetical protein K8Q93_00875 [Candidatus Parcubacteria bacterium]|nr:hypothetical protein [Candidatus Parcubacteria bacterium]
MIIPLAVMGFNDPSRLVVQKMFTSAGAAFAWSSFMEILATTGTEGVGVEGAGVEGVRGLPVPAATGRDLLGATFGGVLVAAATICELVVATARVPLSIAGKGIRPPRKEKMRLARKEKIAPIVIEPS